MRFTVPARVQCLEAVPSHACNLDRDLAILEHICTQFFVIFGCFVVFKVSTQEAYYPSERKLMLVVHVHVHVKPEAVERFKAASLENARMSVQEAGVARFDVVQQQDDPTRFVLVEVYRTLMSSNNRTTRPASFWWRCIAHRTRRPPTSKPPITSRGAMRWSR